MASPRRSIAPRVLAAPAVASYLGRSLTWFYDHRDELLRAGFPKPISLLGGWDREAIDRWLSGLPAQAGADDLADARSAWEGAGRG